MPNKNDSDGMIHQWIYVIIPVGKYNDPCFAAFCKGCRSYFTEKIPRNLALPKLSSSSLPRYGCVLPDDVPVV